MTRRINAKQSGNFKEKESDGFTIERKRIESRLRIFPSRYTEADICDRNLFRVATQFS